MITDTMVTIFIDLRKNLCKILEEMFPFLANSSCEVLSKNILCKKTL